MELLVTIRDKIATYAEMRPYVCGNSDYVIHFDMDEEWAAHETKTARFVKDNGAYQDQVFTGNDCPVPVISNTFAIRVGVFAGDLHTTTPAYIPAKKSILCGSAFPADPAPDVYAQLMEHLNQIEQNGVSEAEIKAAIAAYLEENPVEGVTPEEVEAAIEKYMQEHPVLVEESDPTVPSWAKQPEKPSYTAEEIGAQPKGEYALKSEIPEIPAPYELPTASASVKGGVKVGNGLVMDGETLGVKPEGEYELIESITLEEDAAIKRTQEPDGTPYNFSAMYVEIITTAANPAGYNVYFSFNNYVSPPIWVDKLTNNTATKYAYVECYKQYGIYRGRYRTHTTNNYITTIQESVYSGAKGNITRFNNNYSQLISAGTVINIWGVRA